MGICGDGNKDRKPAPTRANKYYNTQDIKGGETTSIDEKELLKKREKNLIYKESNKNAREQYINKRENEIQQINKSTYSKQYIIDRTENKVNYPEFEENNHDKKTNYNL